MNDPFSTSALHARLAALAAYGIFDTDPEPAFDDIATIAARLCGTPIALVSLIAETRQFFKSRIGLPEPGTPIGMSVCRHALAEERTLIIPDLTQDPRTRDNPSVTGAPHIRFYAGAILRNPEGVPLGTLCVIDTEARPAGLSAKQKDLLEALARQVMSLLELRDAVRRRSEAIEMAVATEARAKQREQALKDDLAHRLKNQLAVVQAIVSQSLRGTDDPRQAGKVISERIQALSRAQEILASPAGGSLRAIIAGVLQPQDAPGRFRVFGGDAELTPRGGLFLALALHELATNALRHGSLTAADGHVEIEIAPTSDSFSLRWTERGGGPATQPSKPGFGTRVIRDILPTETGGAVSLDYGGDGFSFRLDAPRSSLQPVV